MISMIYIDLVKTIAVLVFFVIASYMDIKKREIDDRVWILMFLFCFPITLYEILLSKIYISKLWVSLYLISSSVGVLFSYGLYKLGLMGGADAKAFMVLSIIELPRFGFYGVLPSLSILLNSVVSSLSFMLFIVARNFFLILRGVKIFDSYKNSFLEKIIAFMTLTLVSKEEFRKNSFKYIIAEKMTKDGPKIDLRIRIVSEVPKCQDFPNNYVWVSYLMPMIVFIAIGYFLYKTIGCLIFYLFPI